MDEKALVAQIAEMMEQQQQGMLRYKDRAIGEQTTRIEVLIENSVSKRIDSLFDGYKLTHEKQYELERKVEALEDMLQHLQERLTLLENKTA